MCVLYVCVGVSIALTLCKLPSARIIPDISFSSPGNSYQTVKGGKSICVRERDSEGLADVFFFLLTV